MPASLADPDAGGRATTAPPDPAPDVATTRQTATGAGEITVGAVGLAAIGVYVGVQVISQVTSLKIGTVADRAVDMGTFIYPITFTLRDVIHKAAGRRAARIAIWTSAGVNLFLAAYLSWVAAFTTDRRSPMAPDQTSASSSRSAEMRTSERQ